MVPDHARELALLRRHLLEGRAPPSRLYAWDWRKSGRERPSGRSTEPTISDVVHRRAGLTRLALDHVGDRRLREHPAGGLGGGGEDALGVASERAIEQLDDLQHAHRRGLARKPVAALYAPLRADHPGAAQRGEQLLEELHGHIALACQ